MVTTPVSPMSTSRTNVKNYVTTNKLSVSHAEIMKMLKGSKNFLSISKQASQLSSFDKGVRTPTNKRYIPSYKDKEMKSEIKNQAPHLNLKKLDRLMALNGKYSSVTKTKHMSD